MYRILLVLIINCIVQCLNAQNNAWPVQAGQSAVEQDIQLKKFTKYLRYSDFHIHPTYKHYFRFKTAEEMKLFVGAIKFDGNGHIVFDTTGLGRYKNENWEKNKKTKEKELRKGAISTLKNYDQSGYPEIIFVPGSILCNSYSPYEKQFALKGFKRLISSLVVTGMGLPRLKTYSEDYHTPLNDFLAEYCYNLIQEEKKFVQTWSPAPFYKKRVESYVKNPPYYNRIKMVRDSLELDSIIQYNNNVFKNWNTDIAPLLITPMVMSIEGGQVLYGPLSASKEYILNPLNMKIEGTKFFHGADEIAWSNIKNELLNNARLIKNLPHRLFFITLAHFAQNHVVGFAKTLDRDPENIQHRSVNTLTSLKSARNDIIRKTYDGFNPGCEKTLNTCTPDSFGFKIVETFLDTSNTKFKKPTYIDVKHMDIKARIQYYYMRRKYVEKFKVPIPIIASHFAVSGERQAMAAATGLRPNFDRYEEVTKQKEFQNDFILMNNDVSERYDYWYNTMLGLNYPLLNKKFQKLDDFEMGMYRSMDFRNGGENFFAKEPYDPFKGFVADPRKTGWFYPWSINLFDEEIIEINKSDGLIGLLLDPRQLGAYMPKYKKIEDRFGPAFTAIFNSLTNEMLAPYDLTRNDIDQVEYFKCEPLIRNIFYIVREIKEQQAAEKFYKESNFDIATTQKSFPLFIPDTLYCYKDAWESISIGGDFDGLIDPIDFSPTAAYIPLLRRRMVVYCYIFSRIHTEFKDPVNHRDPYIIDLADSDKKMEQFFYSNLQKFIGKYF